MKQNDRRNAKISEVCRVLANACMSENTTLYPEDVMTFVNESRNSDIKELLALHMALNEADAIRTLEKNIECVESWQHYIRPIRVRRRRWSTYDECHYLLEEGLPTWQEVWDEYQALEACLDKTEEEIAIWEWLTGLPGGTCTDNYIAFETAYAIAEENARREHQLSQIACDAVKKHVHYGTVIHFMNEMCKDDKERTFFLQEYSNAQWRDGRFN